MHLVDGNFHQPREATAASFLLSLECIMPAAIRLGIDKSAGHGGFPPTAPITASSNVRINGIRAVRAGDKYAPHRHKKKVHGSRVAVSRSNVRINGKPAHRTGDPISCGDRAGRGSSTVRFS